jgi:hypothetical protein
MGKGINKVQPYASKGSQTIKRIIKIANHKSIIVVITRIWA